jgi:hypothetical protein
MMVKFVMVSGAFNVEWTRWLINLEFQGHNVGDADLTTLVYHVQKGK